jgi:hypothetical protein
MRTTLTLEPDVAAGIERLRQERGLTLKAAVNEALRSGIRALGAPPEAGRGPYETGTWNGGEIYLDNIDDVAEALARLEGDAFR